jgi:hypothetical protein
VQSEMARENLASLIEVNDQLGHHKFNTMYLSKKKKELLVIL